MAARHLHHMGYNTTVVYPKQSAGPLFAGLVTQCKQLGIPVKTELSPELWDAYDLIIDGLFGFSFSGPPREPFSALLRTMEETPVPIISIDIPSGWEVDTPVCRREEEEEESKGKKNSAIKYIKPRAVISLTLPKVCMIGYLGTHYIGGRFVPPALADYMGLEMPPYASTEQIVKVSTGPRWPAPHVFDDTDNERFAPSCAEAGLTNGGRTVLSLVAAPTREAAQTMADALVEAKLVACVNVIPSITSTYLWEGKVEHSEEVLMVLKSRADEQSVQRLTRAVKEMHSYDTPEVIQVPVVGGLGKYIDWVLASTHAPRQSDRSPGTTQN